MLQCEDRNEHADARWYVVALLEATARRAQSVGFKQAVASPELSTTMTCNQ